VTFTLSDTAPGFTACEQTSPEASGVDEDDGFGEDEPAQPASSIADTARVERRARGRRRKMGPRNRWTEEIIFPYRALPWLNADLLSTFRHGHVLLAKLLG
jgi:hypothetical protein